MFVKIAVPLVLLLAASGTAFADGPQLQPQRTQKSRPSQSRRTPADARLNQIIELNRELIEQLRSYSQASDEKIRRLTGLIAEYERLAGDRVAEEIRQTQERTARYTADAARNAQVDALESQVRRLEQQLRETEMKLQQYQQTLDSKQREIQQLEDRLRAQPLR